MEYYLAVRMRRMGSAFSHDAGTYGRPDSARPNGPHLPPTVGPGNGVGGPIVSRPSLVAGSGRGSTATATDTRPTASPRLRQVRSQEGY
jgi:hypothetical protein